jgi:glycosyltransferase involved in cell wall biosynthesis
MRLAIVLSHPIQYYSPWFSSLAGERDLDIHIFYLWNFGVSHTLDQGFQQSILWDVPLLNGYHHTFVPNVSNDPGTHHFLGLNNPSLASHLLAWNPDAILLYGYNYLTHIAQLLDPRLFRIPFLFRGDSHSLCVRSDLKSRIARLLRTMIFKRFAAFMAVGKANAAWLRESGVAPTRISLAPHAVDNDRFIEAANEANASAITWRHQLGIPAESTIVLFAGKFTSKKCPLLLIDAFLSANHPSAVLVLAGAGHLEDEIRHRAVNQSDTNIRILPFQNQSAMPSLYALANLVVLPSLGHGETWGLCINEAMVMARPVIVSSHVGCASDLVISRRTGWIFPAGNQQALTHCLNEALADPIRLKVMGAAAQEHVANYSYTNVTRGLREALSLAIPT